MTEYRYFNGKKYKLHNRTPSKWNAYDAAKSWRKYGYNARVTKGIRKYAIWIREK